MCGICGKFSRAGVKNEEIHSMLDSINHRGPDDEGVYISGCVGLGNRRLSIIDLPGGKQPICNETGKIWITFNGEIYNYRQLRQQLESKGHIFRTNSDTEVTVHLYEDLGESCVKPINGMFAFAIWDATQQKLFLARDRIGQKPIYYSLEDGVFIFASEMKAILSISRQKPEMDTLAMHDFLSLRFIPPPQTIFQHIKKLPPAHTLVYQDGAISIQRYWELSFQEKLGLSETELLEILTEQLTQTVETHLVSDVPVGAFLSGGLDSSMIVAILCRDLKQIPQTFSIGVKETDFDELPYARMVAEKYGTRHIEERVTADLIHSLPKIIWHMDEPSDPIAACMFQAARLASQHVKAVLGGDGGDELFAGFDRYMGKKLIDAYSYLPHLLRSRLIGPFLERIPDGFTYKSTTQKLRWVHQLSLKSDAAQQYAEATLFFRFNHQQKRELYTPQLWRQLGEIDSSRVITAPFNGPNANELLDRMLYTDYVTRLPEHSLMLTDRMTMAHGLEARSPFLDHNLVELLARFPGNVKVRNGRGKYLLRKLAKDYLPEIIVHREKQGFMFPIAYWLRTELYTFMERVLTNSFFVREGLFSKDNIQRLLHEHKSRRVDHHVRLWMLLNLEVWQQLFIEQALPENVDERLEFALRILD
jgi:asparagine synthase (glutamine-hydrolysing)